MNAVTGLAGLTAGHPMQRGAPGNSFGAHRPGGLRALTISRLIRIKSRGMRLKSARGAPEMLPFDLIRLDFQPAANLIDEVVKEIAGAMA